MTERETLQVTLDCLREMECEMRRRCLNDEPHDHNDLSALKAVIELVNERFCALIEVEVRDASR